MKENRVVLFLTDIEGSTSMWEGEAVQMALAVARHEDLIGHIVEEHNGRVVKTRGEGDALFCVFEESASAVACSIAAQRAFASEPWPTTRPIRMRIAIHTGEVDGRDGDFFGPTVNRCARLRGIAHGGQIIVSGAVWKECCSQCQFVDQGRHRLKDLLVPEQVYEVVWSDVQFPPLRSLNALDHNLPVQLTSFIGRDSDIAALVQCVGNSRLVTLTGFGGTGKTRLALQVAAQLVDSGFQAVRFVPLSELPPGADVAALIARSVGVPITGTDDPMTAVIEAYTGRDVLFVVDNCEHVVESAAAAISWLLAHCDRLRVLATSRENLGLSGEQIVSVGPLSLPSESETHPVRALESEAVSLFVDRVRLKGGRIALDSASTPSTVKLVRTLDGIPLAIEQAAARVSTLGLDAVFERLGKLLDVLATTDRDIEPRQRTVRATVSWSHDLLGEEEKMVFANLATFQGAFLLREAIELIGHDVVEHVESLAHKSLLFPVELSSQVRGYRLLVVVRDYGREQIPLTVPDAYDNHTAWCLETAERISEQLIGTEQADALNDLDRIYGDLIEGVRRTVKDRSPLALPLAFAMRRAWLVHGPTTDGVTWLGSALMEIPHDDERLIADAHNALGAMANACGLHDKAVENLSMSRRAFESLRDYAKVGATNINLGITHSMVGDYTSAKSAFEAGIAAYRKTTDDRGIAQAHLNYGRMLLDSGANEDAAVHYDEALRYYRETDPLMETTILTGLAEIHAKSAPDRALEAIERALSILEGARDPSKLGMALVQLAGISANAGLFEDAAFLTAAAKGVTERLNSSWSAHAHELLASLDATLCKEVPKGDLAAIQARAGAAEVSAVIDHALMIARRVRNAMHF